MSKTGKRILAILLLPLCLGATSALFRVLKAASGAETFWVAALAGVACWLVIYLLLPKPMWIYILGHELTHALWTWFFAGRVKRFKVTSRGGQVSVTRSNFLIALAPYFFPIYGIAIMVMFALGNMFWEWSRYLVYFHLLIGAAYSFHVTLTWHVLKSPQSDLAQHGYLFSIVLIWLANVGLLLLAVPLLTAKVELATVADWCWFETARVLRSLGAVL